MVTAKHGRLIEAANKRLQLPVPEFALLGRKKTIGQLMEDRELLDYIDAVAVKEKIPKGTLLVRARRYAANMGPRFSALFYFKIGYLLARTLIRLHYHVRVVSIDVDAMSAVSPDATVILVGNHRSNFDPLVCAYLASRRSTVSLSAGEWARLWPFRQLVRASGGFVVDRSADDPLYRQVLASYVRLSAANGVHHAFFPEGVLTRSGRMGPPKLGFLNFFCRACSEHRDIVFIPAGINYDRIPEDRKLSSAEQSFDRPKIGFLIFSSLRYVGSVLMRVFSRSRSFGYACVAFGEPVSLTQWLRERDVGVDELATSKRYHWLPEFANELMQSCAAEIPATPVVLVAAVMCGQRADKSWATADLADRVTALIEILESRDANCYVPDGVDAAIASALSILSRNGLVRREADDHYFIVRHELPVLQHYARSIEHLTL